MNVEEIVTWSRPIIEEFAPMTVRQLYYQLASRRHIPNSVRAYKSYDHHLTRARERRLIDAGDFVDRSRPVRDGVRPGYPSLEQYLQVVKDSYRRDPLEGQPSKVEVWIEKDALSQIVADELEEWRPTIVVTRGYSPYTLLHEARERLMGEGVILYFGDFDPTGLDIFRDIEEKLGDYIEVKRIALTREQVDDHDLLPLPTKPTDTRQKDFVSRHGDAAYELDALPPDAFRDLLREIFADHIDEELVGQVQEQTEEERQQLKQMVDALEGGRDDEGD